MPWGRSRDADRGGENAIEISSFGNGLVLEGSPTAVTAFVDQLVEVTKEAGGRSRHLIVDGMQIAANLAALRQTHREYIEFSGVAKQRLGDHGAIPTDGGYFRSFVRDGKEFAGNLDWKPVSLGPEQALSLQAMAGQMALRAAIREVTVALERIEGKIDKLAALAEAERLGAVVADRSTLQPLVDDARTTGRISRTDWETVASLGPLIARDVETLRAYIQRQLTDVKDSSLVRIRAGEAEELTDRLLKESLALLVVAEQNYVLWQELRLAHVVSHERAETAKATAAIERQLEALTAADQALVDTLQDVANRLSQPTGYEGLAVVQKRRLIKHVAQLDEMSRWFCEQRHLDDRATERPEFAGFQESLGKARDATADVARTAAKAIADSASRVRRRDERDAERTAELTQPERAALEGEPQ